MTPVAVHTLIEMTAGAAANSGIRSRDLLVPAGSYRRRPPRYLGIEHVTNTEWLREHSAALVQDHPPIYRIVLEALVAGQGAVITASGQLVADSVAEFLNHGLVPDGLSRRQDAKFDLSNRVTRDVSVPSLLVKRPWWRNYGHWLVDGAALLAMIPWGRMPPDWQIVVGAHESARMRGVIYDTLAVMAPHVPIIEQPDSESWHFSELHYITPVHVPPLFKLPAARQVLRHAFLHDSSASAQPTGFYVQRACSGGRAVANEAELIEVCAAHGLSVVHPEQFSVREQAHLFASCNLVVGVKGAALANAIFSSSPMAMIALSPSTWTDPFFWDLVAQADMEYIEIMGPVKGEPRGPSDSNFWIDPILLSSVLDDQVAKSGPACPQPPAHCWNME